MSRQCCYCNKTQEETELRPYGPNGKDVCFDCAMATPERMKQTDEMFTNLLKNSGPIVLIGKDTGPEPYVPTDN